MLEGRVPPARVLDELLAALPRETDELNVQQMLDYVRAAFWRFTAADDRARSRRGSKRCCAPASTGADDEHEGRVVRRAAQRRDDARDAGLARTGLAPRGEDPGLPLAETDEADLALDLAVRDVPTRRRCSRRRSTRFKNPDRKARFAFVMPAVSRDRPCASRSSRA